MNLPTAGWQVGLLLDLYEAALAAADPLKVVPPHLPDAPRGRTVVIGVGKAAAAMAMAVEQNWRGPLSGVVVVPEGASLPLQHIEVHESSHPVPDQRSVIGAERLLAAVTGLARDDLVIALISGGGSALCSLPAEGLSLAEKQHITTELLRRGAAISEFNTVRRHLSRIKGGRLAAQAHPARVVSLVISDIPGDDPALVASGPTLPDTSTCADALAILSRYGLEDVGPVRQSLEAGIWESVKPGDPRLAGHEHALIATGRMGLNAAAALARARGYDCHVLSDAMEGESRELAKAHAAIALSSAQHEQPFRTPCVLLSGGEATVTVRGNGRGGRNTEFVLALALALKGRDAAQRVYALSAGTDGLDGRAGAAGAWMTPSTLRQISDVGLAAAMHLEANDSATVFDAVSSLVHTGPTHTNINDFRAVFVAGE
ncbi:glycerate kinase [Piscinibacter sp. HJYY11]|uniref:glycerate kinase type-2 family protein n=1 Tax=Piscinibacter sp. HJYY11 TaxID=2801333 RepID=UPI00191EA79E|nr:glycerate kinase [Piscinibacter sp. HJYY11]MBL0729627.1 glycerate kinase [Piscinibacter sp. HJYY11]